MSIPFSKYHGAGNDFVLIDNRNNDFTPTAETVKQLCHRQFGVGADGLMLLENDTTTDFRMRYFNSDGGEATMCGNGGRCIVVFANRLGIITTTASFMGVDGIHEANIIGSDVSLKMKDVDSVETDDDFYLIDTGSPHFVKFVENVDSVNVATEGKIIRNSYNIGGNGVNANFVQITPEGLKIRTFERGVEAETLACGTGAVAAAIAATHWLDLTEPTINVFALGGTLRVSFNRTDNSIFSNIWLTGPAVHVFDGEINIPAFGYN
jgi:diaminopimelate epimerase